MKVGVTYRDVATTKGLVGGGDVFLIYLLKALKTNGHTVKLLTTAPTAWDIVEKDLGWVTRPDEEELYSLPQTHWLLKQFNPPQPIRRLKQECDVTFNSYGQNLFWNTDFIYVHTPPTRQELTAKYRGVSGRAYWRLYRILEATFKPRLVTKILTNSEYSKKIVEDTWHMNAEVVYPPVDTETYRKLSTNRERNDWVVTIARFTKEKQLELIPEIASQSRGEYHIIGNTAWSDAKETITSIQTQSIKLGVEDRVHLHINISRAEKLEVMAKAKVYLHTCPVEHFGLTVAEAMSAGLAPIVPCEGGQVEIVPNEDFTYGDLEEAAQKVEYWLGNWSKESALYFFKAAERFSYERFREEIDKILLEAGASKVRG